MRLTKEDIGKEFYPVDNSYSQDLTNGQRPKITNGAALAGDWNTPGTKVQLIFGPFTMTVRTVVDTNDTKEFFIVEYDNRLFLVLNCFSNEQPQPFEMDEDYMYYYHED